MKNAGFIILLLLGQLLMAQEGEVNTELPSQDTAVLSPETSPQDTSVLSPEISLQDSSTLAPEIPPDPAPFISTEDPAEVSADLPLLELAQEAEQMQEPTLVKYSSEFQFGDGIYANFDMVLANDPIPPARIVTDLDMFDRAFYEKITAGKEIVIYDENGVKKELPTHEVWGYGRNGVIYINVGSAFHRISFVGSICHFVATVTTYNPNYYDPYYYNPYYSSSYYYNRYSMPQSNTASTDLRQYLLDFETGDVMEYDTESVEVLLMKDPELADEFHSLSNRKKKQMKFVFIRRFNERNPLYFPVY